jgi:hypothetical protein
MVTKEKFDDESLLRVAKSYYKAGCYNDNAVKVLNQAGSILSTIERNILVQYVDKYHEAMLKNARTGMSMKHMRDALLKKAGREDLCNSSGHYDTGTISSRQLRAIYNHVMGIEELKED